MKITISKAIEAYIAANKLKGIALDWAARRELKDLCEKLKKEVDFYCESELEAVKMHGGNTNGNKIDFGEDKEEATAFRQEIAKLKAVEVELDCPVLRLRGVSVSIIDEDILEGIIVFEE